MANSTPTATATPVEPGVVAAALALWLVTFDNGQLTSVLSRGDLFFHEFFHDGRHIVGVPCH